MINIICRLAKGHPFPTKPVIALPRNTDKFLLKTDKRILKPSPPRQKNIIFEKVRQLITISFLIMYIFPALLSADMHSFQSETSWEAVDAGQFISTTNQSLINNSLPAKGQTSKHHAPLKARSHPPGHFFVSHILADDLFFQSRIKEKGLQNISTIQFYSSRCPGHIWQPPRGC